MNNVSVIAITKNGVKIGEKLKELFPDWNIFVPSKFSNESKNNMVFKSNYRKNY